MDVSTTTGGGDFLSGQGGIGTGGGFIGGILLGALLGNGNGIFGGRGRDGLADSAVLRNPPEQNQANMDLMAAIGAVDKEVAVNMAAMEASNAAQSAAITASLNSVASSLATRVDGLKDVMNTNNIATMQQFNALDKSQTQNSIALMQQLNQVNTNLMAAQNAIQQSITADGTTTRALITAQYENNLQRELGVAQAEIIELRGDRRLAEVSRGIEVNTTNNINQMQQQQQQQAQYGQLTNLLWGLAQNIRNDNSAINVGSGTQTSTPTNTNTNIR
jgi:hypothetical protein